MKLLITDFYHLANRNQSEQTNEQTDGMVERFNATLKRILCIRMLSKMSRIGTNFYHACYSFIVDQNEEGY